MTPAGASTNLTSRINGITHTHTHTHYREKISYAPSEGTLQAAALSTSPTCKKKTIKNLLLEIRKTLLSMVSHHAVSIIRTLLPGSKSEYLDASSDRTHKE